MTHAPIHRLATDADGQAIGALVASVFAEYPGCLFEPSEFPELAAVASHYAAKGGCIWVLDSADGILGSFAIFRSGPDTFELGKVYLHRASRGTGLGRRMLDEGLAFARARGARRLELFSDTRFHEGHRFYERNGFVRLPGERYLPDVSDTWEFHYERVL